MSCLKERNLWTCRSLEVMALIFTLALMIHKRLAFCHHKADHALCFRGGEPTVASI